MTRRDELLAEEIQRQIRALSLRRQEEIGLAGAEEQLIANLYFRLGDMEASGEWWVRAAQEAERFGQLVIAHQRLVIACRNIPTHLALRRELNRLAKKLESAESI